MRKVLLLLLLTLLVSLAHAQDDTLPREIASVAAAHRVDGAGLSVFVQAVDAPAPELSFNAAVPRSPASVIKLLTTFAALEVLGPAWRWRTEVWTTGEMDGERLTGDLIFKGGGDPALSMEKLWTLLRELRSRGIGRVEGDLVIDNTLFAPDPGDPNGFDGQPYRTYNVQPDALLVNHKAVGFRVRNGANGEVEATLDPPLSGFTVENRLRRARGRCGGFQRGVAFDLPGGPAGTQAVLSGSFPSGCSEYTLWRTVLDGPRFADAAIRPLWREIGGSIDGGLRVEPVPPEARRVLVFESIPLGEVVQQINKWSNNVMTRHLLLTLGLERLGPPATREKGRQALQEWLQSRGLEFPELFLDNGSGLSRRTRISAASLGQLLLHAWSHPYMAEFVSSLPLSGMDGTLRSRYRGAMAGRLHLKTGSLDDVSSVAGIVSTPSGRRYVVVVMLNAPGAHRGPGHAMQDAVIRWLFRR
jgi:D-alanyl-D-alanine carboxypeptidase/D-alanyl-D-alanine-endopeptidase (penicillin-binding protein 4)